MKRDLAEAVALGVCTFNYDQSDGDRQRSPAGFEEAKQPAKPSEPCVEICPYCQQQAEYLLKIIANFDTEKEDVAYQ